MAWICDRCGLALPFDPVPPVQCRCVETKSFSHGPGWHLEQIIPSILHSHSCGCAAYARKMDRWGVDGCEQRFDRIVRRLTVMAAKQGLANPLQRLVCKRWVRQAIDRARH